MDTSSATMTIMRVLSMFSVDFRRRKLEESIRNNCYDDRDRTWQCHGEVTVPESQAFTASWLQGDASHDAMKFAWMFFSKIRASLKKGDDLLVDPLAEDVSTLRQHGLIDSQRNLIDSEIRRLESTQADADNDFASRYAVCSRLARKWLRKPIPVVDNTSTILSLKSRRNELALISLLPPEILTYVFSLCVPHTCIRDPFQMFSDPIEGFAWIGSISHVCRQWRDISLGNASLWTCLTPSNPAWLAEMLSRSKEAPLHVRANFFVLVSESLYLTTLALRNLSRIQHLSLILPDWSFIKDLLSHPAPLLISFDLAIHGGSFPFLIPESIFSGNAPLLSRLALYRCYFPWNSSLYTNITHLRLSRIRTNITMPQFLATLDRMTMLRELNLCHSLPSLLLDVTKAPEARFSITLRFLSLVSLEGPATDCVYFLNHLQIPKNTTLRLLLEIQNPTVDSLDDILSSVARHCCTNNIRGLMIETETGPRIQAWPTTDMLPRHNTNTTINEPTLFLRIASILLLWPKQLFLHTITEVCSTLPLHDLRVLRWSHLTDMPWKNCIRYLRSVETLFVDADSAHGLLVYLEEDVRRVEVRKRLHINGEFSPGGDILEEVSFPALETLICRGASFGEVLANEERMRVLKEWLKQRKGLGLGLKALQFRHCQGLATVALAQLRVIVPDVLWVQSSKDDVGDE